MRQTRGTENASSPPANRTEQPPLYTPLDFVLVRTPLLPIEAYTALTPSLDQDTPAADLPAYLLQDPRVRRALAVGSSALWDALERRERAGLTPRDTARLQSKLRRYVIRMATRPTPYGLFAGVALGRWGPQTDLAVAHAGSPAHTRPDMAWLLTLVQREEARLEVRQHLRLVANPAALVQGGRVFLPERAWSSAADPPQSVSVRATSVVLHALAFARTFVAYTDLAAYLEATAPGATPEKVQNLLTELWQQTLLLTDLRPPLTTADPAQYVRDRLAMIPPAQTTAAELTAILTAAAAWDALPAREAAPAYHGLVMQAQALQPLADGAAPFQVDMVVALQGQHLAAAVGAEAARAAEILLRVTPWPRGLPHLATYRQRFFDRYGLHREVPLLELLDPGLGLGPPPAATSTATIPAGQAVRRSQTLLQVATQALHDHQPIVDLDVPTLARLETAPLTPATAPLSLDLNVFVASASVAALDAGDFQIIIGPNLGAPAAGRNLGRFAGLLAAPGRAALAQVAQAEATRAPNLLAVELSYLPRQWRSANVVIRPLVRRHEIAVGVSSGAPAARVVPVSELVVGLRDDRFYLRWVAGDQEVRICAGHMLNTRRAPALCRFLSDMDYSSGPQIAAFDWGPVSTFPFLPRVQAGRIVLRPAQWRIPRRQLRPEAAPAFADGLAEWRAHWQAPRHVHLTAADNRLLLDLTDPWQVEELRQEVRRLPEDGTVLLQEMLPDFTQVWLPGPGGHFVAEMVVSLVRRPAGAPQTDPRAGETRSVDPGENQAGPAVTAGGATPVAVPPVEQRALPRMQIARLAPPGSDWLFLKLYCPRSLEDDVIADALGTFAAAAGAAAQIDDWFFIRYADPDPHLRVRFRGRATQLTGDLLPALCRWAGDLVTAGLVLRFSFDTYDREVERYGGLAGLALAETLFAADSRAVVELLSLLQEREITLDRTALAVLTVDDLLASLDLEPEDRLVWCRGEATGWDEVGAAYRQRKALLRGLLENPLGALAEGHRIVPALAARRAVVVPLAARLRDLAGRGELSQPLAVLYRSYVHLHCNRLLAAGTPEERTVLGLLWRTREGLARTQPSGSRAP